MCIAKTKLKPTDEDDDTAIIYAGVILLKEYQFFPKKDQNQTTF